MVRETHRIWTDHRGRRPEPKSEEISETRCISYRDHLDFGRDCAETRGLLIGILSPRRVIGCRRSAPALIAFYTPVGAQNTETQKLLWFQQVSVPCPAVHKTESAATIEQDRKRRKCKQIGVCGVRVRWAASVFDGVLTALEPASRFLKWGKKLGGQI